MKCPFSPAGSLDLQAFFCFSFAEWYFPVTRIFLKRCRETAEGANGRRVLPRRLFAAALTIRRKQFSRETLPVRCFQPLQQTACEICVVIMPVLFVTQAQDVYISVFHINFDELVKSN